MDSYVKVDGLAREGELHRHVFRWRSDSVRTAGAITANYWLSEIYDEEIANAHRSGDIHLHDLSMLTGYCAGWSLKQLIQEGLGGVPGKITSKPASHLAPACATRWSTSWASCRTNGRAPRRSARFDTYLAPFVKVDNLTYEEVKQCVESFVFGVNTPSPLGHAGAVRNITLDWVVPG